MTKYFTRVFILLFLLTGSINASDPVIKNSGISSVYQLQKNVTSSDYASNTIILKIKSENRSYCTGNSIDIPGIQKVSDGIQSIEIKKMFPNVKEPLTTYNEHGDKLVDLSLIYIITYKGNADLIKIINSFLNTGIVEYAEPKFIPRTQSIPNDPGIVNQYFLTNIQAYNAWNISQGDSNVVIGITDTGTDMDHPDLAANIKINYADPINGVDDDNDGYIDNYYGWDLGESDNFPQVGSCGICSHGSHVSGCADAVTNNGTGVASVGYNCKFLPVKIANASGILSNSYEGIEYAADHGCSIINCSWGGDGGGTFGQDIINYATYNKNALVVVAAGNNGNSNLFYPAAYDNVLAVAATDSSDFKAFFSSYGTYVDVCAPGYKIYSTVFNDNYQNESGTSMASPITAGCAAIVKSFFPGYIANQIAERLRVTCDNIDAIPANAGYAGLLGHGRINLYSALTNLSAESARFENVIVGDSNDNVFVITDTMRISGDIKNYLDPSTNLTLTLSTTSPYVTILDNTTLAGSLATLAKVNNSTDPFTVIINPGAPLNAVITFKVQLSDGAYSDFQYFNVIINIDYINIDINDIATTNTSKGRLCFNGENSVQGLGFNLKTIGNLVYESGFMVGISGAVSDNVRGAATAADNDFHSVSMIQKKNPSVWSDFDTYGSFNDSSSPNALGITMSHRSLSWSAVPDNKFHIFEYTIHNTGIIPFTDLYAGVFNDWDIQDYNHNKIDVDSVLKLGYAYSTDANGVYAGVKLLTNAGFTHYAVDNITGGSGGADLSNGYDDNDKFTTLSTTRQTAGGTGVGNDVIDIVGTGPFSLAPGDSVTVAFAMLAGFNLADIQASAQEAQIKYNTVTSIKENNDFAIVTSDPYPNPATDKVTVPFYLKQNTTLTIAVYDATGKLVYLRTPGTVSAGHQQIEIPFAGLESGLYFYRIYSSTDQISGLIQKQ